jgi:hypothetical protein
MHRAVVLTTLVLLLLAVAGVSAAQDSGIFAGGPNSDDPQGSTTQERTSFEATEAEDTMTSALPGASSEAKVGEDASEPTVITEPTVEETEKPTAGAPGEKTLTPGSNNVGKPTNMGRGVGKPEHAGKIPNVGKPPDDNVGSPANGKPQERGNEGEHGRGSSQQKVTLCHKDKKTLTVGAPALAAHQRHGDTQGACQAEGAGFEHSGETMKSEAAKNVEGGGSAGQDKVALCHKNKKTLTLGTQAQAAHMRHGDSLGACRPAG